MPTHILRPMVCWIITPQEVNSTCRADSEALPDLEVDLGIA